MKLSHCVYENSPKTGFWGSFLEAPGNYRAREDALFSIPDGSFKRFKNCTVKLLAKEPKWTLLVVRTHPTFLETLISKSDSGPVKLPGARFSKDPVNYRAR